MCPNWCDCELRVEGPPADLRRFRLRGMGVDPALGDAGEILSTIANDEEREVLSAQAFVPIPEELTATQSPVPDTVSKAERERLVRLYGTDNWYDWSVSNWGTKWDLSDPRIVAWRKHLRYTFRTAWSPPLPAVKRMAAQFPLLTLTLRWWEGGMGFRGTLTVRGDAVLEQREDKYRGSRGG